MSVAGGLPLAVDRAAAHRCETLQIFTRSTSQWRSRVLAGDEIAEFRRRLESTGIGPVVSHASYLINLAAAEPGLRARSIEAFGEEIDRAEALGLLGVVIHPGAHTDQTEEAGLSLVADAVGKALGARRSGTTMVLLEGTAGQGTSLGHRFEQLAGIIDRVGGSPRVGICLDTCHLFAAGFDLATEQGYRETIAAFDRIIGLDRLKALHLNDAKKGCGSRVDRHTHIGEGTIGLEGFARVVRDPRLAHVPMILETPKQIAASSSKVMKDRNDLRNLATLRRLAGGGSVRGGTARRTPRPRT